MTTQVDIAALASRNESLLVAELALELAEGDTDTERYLGMVGVVPGKVRVSLGQIQLEVIAIGRGRAAEAVTSSADRDSELVFCRVIDRLKHVRVVGGVNHSPRLDQLFVTVRAICILVDRTIVALIDAASDVSTLKALRRWWHIHVWRERVMFVHMKGTGKCFDFLRQLRRVTLLIYKVFLLFPPKV